MRLPDENTRYIAYRRLSLVQIKYKQSQIEITVESNTHFGNAIAINEDAFFRERPDLRATNAARHGFDEK